MKLALGYYATQDYAEAVKWYRKAAERGDVTAQYNLGLMYYKGEGILQDFVSAHMCLNIASLASEKKDRNKAIRSRNSLTSKMTPAQIAKAQRMALEWKPKKGR